MNDAVEEIKKWAETMGHYDSASWERLPEIDLYIDRVITYMDRQLGSFQRTAKNKFANPSMINRILNDKVLDRPEQKQNILGNTGYSLPSFACSSRFSPSRMFPAYWQSFRKRGKTRSICVLLRFPVCRSERNLPACFGHCCGWRIGAGASGCSIVH